MTQKTQFKKVGLISKPNSPDLLGTLSSLINLLQRHHIHLTVSDDCPSELLATSIQVVPRTHIALGVELVIVVGGDGSLLNTVRAIMNHNPEVPILGVNRGHLGFLTDISPSDIETQIPAILQGHYQEEVRTLLQGDIIRHQKPIHQGMALNDIVLYSTNIAKMIEFEVLINQQFVYQQRSDGLIVATATGSTAYALSAGGPIMHPNLNAWLLVPMHPHTLTNRPIVVDDKSHIILKITENNNHLPKVSFDGQIHFDTQALDEIHITQFPKKLRLIHPTNYDYYAMLRGKLGWNN